LFFQVVCLKLMKMSFLSHLINFFRIKRAIKRVSPELIFINNGGYPASLQCCVGVFAARCAGLSEIYFNINNMAAPRSALYERFLDQYIGKYVTRFVTASFAAQKHAVLCRSFDSATFMRVPNTIYGDLEVLKKFKVKERTGKLIFGSVGLLTERKGYHILLRAVKLLIEDFKFTDFKVKLIGDGEDKLMLTNLCKSLNIESYVDFLGFKSDPLADMNDFDVFILPSIRNEDFPYVILEAMLLSKPVIGTQVAGIPEQVTNNLNGFVVEPDREAEMAAAMFKISSAPLHEMGKHSLEIYKRDFSYEKIQSMYVALLTSGKN